MVVTDEQAAALRTYLAGDFDAHRQARGQLDPAAAATGYTALLSAAFCVAAERRFGQDSSPPAVIEFVSAVRSRSPELGEKIDPHTAERLINAVFTYEGISDLDADTRLGTQFLLLAALIGEEHLDGAGLDSFVAEARKLADEWLR